MIEFKLRERADIIKNAESKYEAFSGLLKNLKQKNHLKHTLVYCSPQQIENIQELIQIPYPDVDDVEIVMGYSFIPGKELNDFLAFLQVEKYNKVKEILKNKRKS